LDAEIEALTEALDEIEYAAREREAEARHCGGLNVPLFVAAIGRTPEEEFAE
jgi:hypothetical protein